MLLLLLAGKERGRASGQRKREGERRCTPVGLSPPCCAAPPAPCCLDPSMLLVGRLVGGGGCSSGWNDPIVCETALIRVMGGLCTRSKRIHC